MSMKQVLKMTLVVALALPVLMFSAASAFAGNPLPPGPDEMVIGPAMEGVLVLDADQTQLDMGYSWAKFIGKCKVRDGKEQDVFLSTFIFGDFIALTVVDLINYRLDGAAPAGCFSRAGGEDLIITKVNKLTKYPMNDWYFQALVAEIKIKAVVPVVP